MSTPPTFSGFPQAGLQFLTDLAENNRRHGFEMDGLYMVKPPV